MIALKTIRQAGEIILSTGLPNLIHQTQMVRLKELMGLSKKKTILRETYANSNEMNSALMAILMHYMLYRRNGGLRRQLNVKRQ